MILVVDDRPENILPLKKILELNGFAVDTAESGEEALKRILKTAYSVIILDVQMPGMDGFEVANSISGFSKARDTSIIFLSAVNTEKKFITQGYTSGGTDYLTKPVDPDILVLKVKTLDKLYRQQQELRAAQESLKKAAEQLEIQVQHRTQELLAKNAELERANHELQQFTWVVSHDLKEPLRKMQILQDTIREKYLKGNEEAVSYLDRSIRSSARMSHLITDLLTFSQLAIPEPFQPTQLNALLNDLLPDFEDIIERKKGQVTVGPLPVIDAIPVRIRQIFQNLISNSLKFARPDVPPRISIEGERIGERRLDAPADPNGAFCRIRVQDNGIGFHEKYLERIFVMFQRLHDRASYEGTGIGLAIAKKNVEKHGGLITAQSSEGQGAVFVLVLPLRQSHV